jgi:RNA polymerase sigma-70 factor (ECF subfamily)
MDMQEKVFSNSLDDDITVALNSLHNDFKTVIILCDLEGLSYEEISEFTQCPVGTVRSRIHRARKVLGQKLNDYAKQKGFNVKRENSTA